MFSDYFAAPGVTIRDYHLKVGAKVTVTAET